MIFDDDFMEMMGGRTMMLDEKVEECLAAARRGEESIDIDCSDLTSDEVDYIRREIERRL